MRTDDSTLLGRAVEITKLRAYADDLQTTGRAVLLSGDPGIGKSALVDDLARYLESRPGLVLRVCGVQSEQALPFAALHLLLQPVLDGVADLPPPQRDALEVVLGRRNGEPPPPMLVGLATLTLLADAAISCPVLVMADDMQWLDEPTRTVLWFVARRIASEPILVIMIARTGTFIPSRDEQVESVTLRPLSFIDSDLLVDQRFGNTVSAGRRRRLLELAAGNPLALLELPIEDLDTSGVVGLTFRLEEAFSGRFLELPLVTRLIVLAASLVDTPTVSASLRAVAEVLDSSFDSDALKPAIGAGLLDARHDELVFRHPLVRSAVVTAADSAELATAAEGLILTLDPSHTVLLRGRRQAAADAALAAELEALALAYATAGDEHGAVEAYTLAAERAAEQHEHARLLLAAAEAAERAGGFEQAASLLDRVSVLPTDAGLRARATWLRQLLPQPGTVRVGGDIGPALNAIDEMRRAGDPERALSALQFLATLAWGSALEADAGQRIVSLAHTFGLPEYDPRLLFVHAVAMPFSAGPSVRPHIPVGEMTGTDPDLAWLYGYTLTMVGAVDDARPYLEHSLDALRERGQLLRLPHLLLAYGWNCYLRGDLAAGSAAADEATTIALDSRDAVGVAAGRTLLSFFDALSGTDPDLDWVTNGSVVAGVAVQTPAIRTTLMLARGMAALTRGDDEAAFAALRRVVEPSGDAYHSVFAVIALPDLIDSAVRSGRPDAADLLGRVLGDASASEADSPFLNEAARVARVLLAPDDHLEEAFGRSKPDTLSSRFTRARLELAIGCRLRRMRAIARSRPHLMLARDLFDEASASAWRRRAEAELEAAGIRIAPTQDRALELTPRERIIARLAATGLSNREIAQKLYISHRTVGAHLYAVYRKLGIAGRHEIGEPPMNPV